MEIEIPNGWVPRPYQQQLWDYLESGGKRACAVWHRRAGKDAVCLNWTATAAVQKPANYWHLLPQANQARKAIWDAVNPTTGQRLIDQAFPKEIRELTRENEMMIRLKNGATWQVGGSDNYDALVGSPPYGIVYSEWALSDPRSWDYIRPILAENGGWALFITTPRGNNHAKRTLDTARLEKDWFGQILTVDETKAIKREVLDQDLRELIRMHGDQEGQAIYNQEYYCSFEAPVSGSYYGQWLDKAEKEKRITRVPYEPNLPVDTAWDLGIDDAMAIWFIQQVGQEIHLIDYLEDSGEGLQHYAKELQARPYVYGNHYGPHDIEVRELGTGKSRKEVAASLGIQFTVAPKLEVADGIQAVRDLLPRCWVDSEKCQRGLDALLSYHKDWDEKREVYRNQPVHDWASHGADALRTFATAKPPSVGWKSLPKQQVVRWT